MRSECQRRKRETSFTLHPDERGRRNPRERLCLRRLEQPQPYGTRLSLRQVRARLTAPGSERERSQGKARGPVNPLERGGKGTGEGTMA